MKEKKIKHIDKNTAIVPFDEMAKCGRLDARHYTSGEHEKTCNKKRMRA